MAKSVRQVLLKIKKSKDKGGGAKKYGRNKAKCAKYRAEGRREKNKARRQKRHLKLVAKKLAKRG